jgi:hypothetical protein
MPSPFLEEGIFGQIKNKNFIKLKNVTENVTNACYNIFDI